jgi:hypothetical protein
MWHVWRGERYIQGFLWGREGQGPLDHLGGPGVDVKIKIARIFKNSFVRTRNGLIWLRIEERGGLLVYSVVEILVPKIQGIIF